MTEIEPFGLYIIKDKYFVDFPNDKHMQNKGENRPHYYAIKDGDGLYWMIPISSKVDKFRAKIEDVERKSVGYSGCKASIAQQKIAPGFLRFAVPAVLLLLCRLLFGSLLQKVQLPDYHVSRPQGHFVQGLQHGRYVDYNWVFHVPASLCSAYTRLPLS